MELNLKEEEDVLKAKTYLSTLIHKGSLIELKAKNDTRTSKQNRALHKFFVIVSFALNELYLEFCYTGVKGLDLNTKYTPDIVKNFFWRPIQLALFDIESTKDLNTKQMNEIIDVIIKFFGEKSVVIEFPRKDL